jgi:hypothetical protein
MVEHSSSTETPYHEPALSRQLGLTTATALVVAGDRRGNLPDDRRHGEVAGFAVLAAYSLVDDGCDGSGGSDLLRRPGGEASGGRWGVCLLEGGQARIRWWGL